MASKIHKSISTIRIIMFLLPLAACSTANMTDTRRYDAQLNTWIGRSEAELVKSWGIPDKQYDLDRSTRMVSYINTTTARYPRTVPTCLSARGHFHHDCMDYDPPHVEAYYYETIFTIINGNISQWGHKGNYCRI